MQRLTILLFGVVTYAFFFLTFLYLIAFVGNLQLTPLAEWLPLLAALVPQSIDAGRATGNLTTAVTINLGLILLFGLQHSIMARLGFKEWLHTHLPKSAERSVFVLMATLVLALLMWQWRPIPIMLWEAQSTLGLAIGWSVFAAGFGLVLLSTFLIDHFDLFGLKQVWAQFVKRAPANPQFMTPVLYGIVRHPLYLGFLLAFWSTPGMSAGQLLFALGMTSYILIAIRFEERDLVHFHGPMYERYREQVPMLIPSPGRRYNTERAE